MHTQVGSEKIQKQNNIVKGGRNMPTKISITRALSELKTIESRIRDRIHESVFTAVAQGRRAVTNTGTEISQFESVASSNARSLEDLFERLGKLKSAVTISNAVTKVVIGEVEMTVAEAINTKKIIILKLSYANKLQSDLVAFENSVKIENKKVEERLERLLTEMLKAAGKDPAKDRSSAIDYEKSYLTENGFKLIDPLNVRKLIEKIKKEVELFNSEVDFVLSESNARTEIEV